MPRSDAVRQVALERDGYRCVLCGCDGRDESQRGALQVHHVDPLGMGGSDELDVVENAITLCLDCHAEVHSASKKIVKWEPDVLEVVDIERHKIDHSKLWFYRRRLAEELEPVEARVQGLHRIDGDVARDVWRLCAGDAWRALDPESRSWREYCGARGWDTAKATRLAKRWGDGLGLGLQWGAGETESEYAKRLKAAGGDKEDRSFFYLRVPAGVGTWYRTANEEALRDTMQPGDVLVKAGKVVYGARAEDGKLFGPDGVEIAVERST